MMMKSSGPKARLWEFKSQQCPSLAVYPWARYLTALSLSLSTGKGQHLTRRGAERLE